MHRDTGKVFLQAGLMDFIGYFDPFGCIYPAFAALGQCNE
jgi:hypothetical protein